MTRSAGAVELSRPASADVPALKSDRLHVEIRQDMNLDSIDVEELNGMIAERPDVGVFLTPAWLAGFFAEPPDGVTLSVLLFRQGPKLRGLVPIAVRPTLTHVCVSFVGGGSGSDRVDVLAARGFEALAAETFLEWLAERFGSSGFLLELRDVPATSSIWGAIQRSGLEHTQPLALQPREIYTLPYLELSAAEHASIAESPSACALRSLTKHRRWLAHRCHLRIELMSSVDDALAAFDALAGFLRARWGGATLSPLEAPEVARRHRRAIPLLLADNRLRMIRVQGDDRTIAVFYGVASGRWWGYYLAGFDREWSGRIRLGQILLSTAIDMAVAEGAAEFDFLKGGERVKYAWPVRERATLDADVFSETSGAQFSRARRATRDVAAAISKAARKPALSVLKRLTRP